MIFLAIGIFTYLVYPPAVVYVAATWAAIYLFTFTASVISGISKNES